MAQRSTAIGKRTIELTTRNVQKKSESPRRTTAPLSIPRRRSTASARSSWDEQRDRRGDAVAACEVPLVHREREPAARVDVEERLPHRDVAERAHERHQERAVAERHRD